MSRNLLVSVLMPAYNASSFVRQAMESVLSGIYQNIELLIVDDCSTDDTFSIIDSYHDSRIKVFQNQSNQGYLKSWNFLMSKAEGALICFCDADDYISKDKIKEQVDYLTAHPEISICGCNISIVTENDEKITVNEYPSSWEEIRVNLLKEYNFPFCGSAVMVRRDVYESIGGYRNFFDRLGWEDHDWLIRCCEKFKAGNLPRAHYYYRQTSDSVTRAFSREDIYKLRAKKIGLQIARHKKDTHIDLLDEFDFWKLHEIVLKYERKYIKSKSLLYFDLANSNRSKHRRTFLLKKAIAANPFRLRYYYHFIKSIL